MTQLHLTLPPAAAKSDPWTSHEAARRMDQSGARMRQFEAVAKLVKAHPWSTSAELAATAMARVMGLDRAAIARRLPDAVKVGLVQVCDDGPGGNGHSPRICRVKGSLCLMWGPA